MSVSVGFSQILSSMVELFGLIYTSGSMLWSWLSNPLSQSGYDTLLGELAAYTPLELMFGPALLIVLILGLIKFVNPF